MLSFESFLRLGWSLFKTLLRSAFTRRRELPRFFAQYRPDGMLTREPGDYDVVIAAGRCTGCGACDVRAIELGAPDALGPRGPMAFVRGVSRQAGVDAPFTRDASPALLDALTRVCPTEVPFAPLVALVRRRNAELTAADAMPDYRESMEPPSLPYE